MGRILLNNSYNLDNLTLNDIDHTSNLQSMTDFFLGNPTIVELQIYAKEFHHNLFPPHMVLF